MLFWLRAAAGTVFLIYALVAISVLIGGPWKLDLGLLSLKASQVHKPLSVAAIFFIIWIATGAHARDAWARRSPFAFYILATLMLWLLSFGPAPRLNGNPILYKAPYGWLMALPGFDGVRVPARLAMPAALTLALAAGIGFARLTRSNGTRRLAWTTALAVGILAESWIKPLPLVAAPERLPFLERFPDETVVLEWPLGDTYHDVAAMYRSIYHRHRVMNGFSGYEPKQQPPLAIGLNRGDGSILKELAQFGPLVIVIDPSVEGSSALERQLKGYPGIKRVPRVRNRRAYLLPLAERKPLPVPGPILEVASFKSNIKVQVPGELQDNNLDTIWFHSEHQDGSEEVLVELRQADRVAGVTLTQGPHVYGFPRELSIETSADGFDWKPAWHGETSGLAFRAGLAEPRRVAIPFTFEPRPARFVRLRQLGQDPTYNWVIAELSVHGP
jgi:hypothetical protein